MLRTYVGQYHRGTLPHHPRCTGTDGETEAKRGDVASPLSTSALLRDRGGGVRGADEDSEVLAPLLLVVKSGQMADSKLL